MRYCLSQHSALLGSAAIVSLLLGCTSESTNKPNPVPPAPKVSAKPMPPRPNMPTVQPRYLFTLQKPQGWHEGTSLSLPGFDVAVPIRYLSGKGDVIQVEVTPLGAADLKSHVAELMAAAKRRSSCEEIELGDTVVALHPAIRRVYTDERGQRKTVAHYLVEKRALPNKDRCLAIVCQTSSARDDELKPVFTQAVESFTMSAWRGSRPSDSGPGGASGKGPPFGEPIPSTPP